MQVDIDKLALDELLDLNRRVVRRIQHLQSLRTRAHLDRFEVGDRVSFQSEGRAVAGVVVRVNQKTLSVKTHNTFLENPSALLDQASRLRGGNPAGCAG